MSCGAECRLGPTSAVGRWARGFLGGLLFLLVLAGGCTSRHAIAPTAIPREGFTGVRVVMLDGYTYHFARVRPDGDELVGTYLIVEERIEAGGGVAYVDVAQETRLPLSEVVEVQIKRRDWSKSFLVGAGAVIFGVWLRDLFDGGEADDSASTGKPPQG